MVHERQAILLLIYLLWQQISNRF